MKKSFLVLILFLSLLVSCSKVTKAKVVNFWKVESFEMTRIENIIGGSNIFTINIMNSKFKSTKDFFDKPDTIEDGEYYYNLFTIKKDGTWKIEKRLVYTNNYSLMGQILQEIETGTWSFIKKNKGDDYNRNERIIFNTLKKTYTKNENNILNDAPPNYTFLTGENTKIYTITESTNKRLKLELLERSTNNSNNGTGNGETFTKTSTTRISLVPAIPQ